MNMIRKGQIRRPAKGDITGPVHYIQRLLSRVLFKSLELCCRWRGTRPTFGAAAGVGARGSMRRWLAVCAIGTNVAA
jgi:hypothetical protein